jgi:hypothetical protein
VAVDGQGCDAGGLTFTRSEVQYLLVKDVSYLGGVDEDDSFHLYSEEVAAAYALRLKLCFQVGRSVSLRLNSGVGPDWSK